METLSSVVKRKKRKTRKCLDEIRKRSRRSTNNSCLRDSPLASNIDETRYYNGIKSNKICITSNRLTLAMFPNVIRSETVTRSAVPDTGEEPSVNLQNMVLNTMAIQNETSNNSNKSQSSNSDRDFIKKSDEEYSNSAFNRCSETGQMSLHKDSDTGNLSTQNNSPDSFIIFSPGVHTEESDVFQVSPNDTLSSTSTPSSRSSRGGYGYQLYEEFMSEIPTYLRQNTPALIKEDVMKKTKTFLHNIYVEGCRQECEENILHCMRNSVLKNKKYFIPSEGSAASSPAERRPPTRASPPPACPPARLLLRDTPDYTYYPHKLNH